MKNNDPASLASAYRRFIKHLDSHGSVASRLCDSGVHAWVVFAQHDDVGLTPQERQILEGCTQVTLGAVPDTGHMMPLETPGRVADLIKEALLSGSRS